MRHLVLNETLSLFFARHLIHLFFTCLDFSKYIVLLALSGETLAPNLGFLPAENSFGTLGSVLEEN